MLEIIEIISALGGPIVGAVIITEAVLARIERRDAAGGRDELRPQAASYAPACLDAPANVCLIDGSASAVSSKLTV
jgi:hypothetical protein